MEENLEQDFEIQLQVELNRLKNVIQYIEQAKSTIDQSQKKLENTHAEFIDINRQQEIFKQSIIKITSDIENKINNNNIICENEISKLILLFNKNFQNLSDIKLRIADINLVNNELINRQKIIESMLNKQCQEKNTDTNLSYDLLLKKQLLIESNLWNQNSEQNIKIVDIKKQVKSFKLFNYILIALWIITLIISIIK